MSNNDDLGRIRVSVDEAKEQHDERNALFLDVVDTVAYEHTEYQIEGAVRIAPEKLADEFEQLPEDRAVFTYCTWPREETSASVAFFLRKQDYEAYAIEGGLEAWREAGYPVEAKEA